MPKNIFEIMNEARKDGFDIQITNFYSIPRDYVEITVKKGECYKSKVIHEGWFNIISENFEDFVAGMQNEIEEYIKRIPPHLETEILKDERGTHEQFTQ